MRTQLSTDRIFYVRVPARWERFRRFWRRLLRLERYDGGTPATAFYCVQDALQLIATIDLNKHVVTVEHL